MIRALLAALAAVLALAGCATTQQPDAGAPSPAVAAPAAPVRVQIPALGVDSTLIRTGMLPGGIPEVPDVRTPAQASWADWSPEPGTTGPATLYGHVDGVGPDGRRGTPGVFARIDELAPGDQVLVDRDDGTAVRFEVTRVDTWPKSEFDKPLSDAQRQTYGDVPRPELRLVTCGGSFDEGERSYRDQIVVSAQATP